MPWEKGKPRGNPAVPKDELKRPGPMLKAIVLRLETAAAQHGMTKRVAWEQAALMYAMFLEGEDQHENP